jgi:hypothetical protein
MTAKIPIRPVMGPLIRGQTDTEWDAAAGLVGT